MKKLLLTCLLMIATIFNAQQIDLGIGSTTTGVAPISTYYGYSYVQQILPKSQINANAAGNITGLKFYLDATADITNSSSWVVYLGHTTNNSFASTTDWIPVANLTQVFTGTVTNNAGVIDITLTTPFPYNNVDNLVIAAEENSSGYDFGGEQMYVFNTAANRTLWYRSDVTDPDPATPPSGTLAVYNSVVSILGLTPSPIPACPTVSAPTANATGVAISPEIIWGAVSGATGYRLTVGTTAGGTDIMNNVDVGNVTSYQISPNLLYNTQYFYTVTAYSTSGSSSGCAESSFTTVNIPCPTVTAPTASQSNVSTTPTITWDPVTDATGYKISVGTTAGGTDILNDYDNMNNTSYTFTTPLTNGTKYFYTVNSYNSYTTSSGCTERNFTTVCNAAVAPYTYDVESAASTTSSVISDCWSSTPSGSSSVFRWDITGNGTTTSFDTGPSTAFSGMKYFYTEASSGAAGDIAELYSPFVNVSSLTNPTVQFYYHMFGTNMGELHVDVYDGAAWTNDLLVLTGQQHTSGTATWTQAIIDLSTLTITGNVQVRFRGIRGSDYTGDMAVDDIAFVEAPSCFQPSNLTLDSFTANSATLSWTPPATVPSNGYEFYYDTTNTAPTATTAPNGGTSTASSGTVSGLTANTTYYIWIRSNCGGSQSTWVGPVMVYTGYCTPAPSSVDGDGITNVTFGTSPNTVNNTTAAETGNYGDYTAMIGDMPAALTSTVDITYETGYIYNTKIWVDLNNDLLFDDATELLYTGASTSSNPTTLNASITIPAATPVGNYRMRIGGVWSGQPTPCYTGSWGTFEDYTINVTAAPSCLPPTGLQAVVTPTDATVSWTASGSGPSSYDVYVDTTSTQPATPTYTGITGTSHVIPGTSGTTYYVWVVANCGTSMSPPAGPISYTITPANDECTNATQITGLTTSTPYSNTQSDGGAASNNAGFISCNSGTSGGMNDGVWYQVEGDGTSYSIVVVPNGGWDAEIGVYTGTCGSLSCINSEDSGGVDAPETITFATTVGTTYYINVGHYSDTTDEEEGPFDIQVATDGILGTSEIVKDVREVEIYPNPFTDFINISDVKDLQSVSVVDMSGRMIRTIDKPESRINLSGLQQGMYLLTLRYKDSSIKTVKVIKK